MKSGDRVIGSSGEVKGKTSSQDFTLSAIRKFGVMRDILFLSDHPMTR